MKNRSPGKRWRRPGEVPGFKAYENALVTETKTSLPNSKKRRRKNEGFNSYPQGLVVSCAA